MPRTTIVIALALALAQAPAVPMSAAIEAETKTAETKPKLAFTNANVVPMEHDRVLERYTVLVEGATITRVGPTQEVVVPDDALVVDASGRYLAPGLADMHVHLRSREELVSYLAHGVTTILQLSGANEVRDLVALRAQLERGEVVGPTLYLSGPLIDGERPIFGDVSVAVANAEAARRVVAEQKRAGYDILKIYERLGSDAFDAVIEAAKELGIPVAGHVPEEVGIERVLESGVDLIAHVSCFRADLARAEPGTPREADRIRQLARLANECETTVVANLLGSPVRRFLTDYESIFRDPEIKFVPPHVVRIWRNATPEAVRRYSGWLDLKADGYEERLVKALVEEGVLVLMGTDSPAAVAGLFPGRSAITELDDLVRAGLTRYQALAAATRNAGTFVMSHVRPDARFGLVAAGYRADLVLLDRNPLADLAAYADPAGVCVRGRWLTNKTIAAMREAIAESFAR